MQTNNLNISNIHQGDLVFIVNWDKPTKTGWWRKARMSHVEATCDLFLEKPVHKDYNYDELVKSKSRVEHGVFIMKPNTVDYDQDKYEILFIATGKSSARIVNRGYKLEQLLFQSPAFEDSFYYTNRGHDLFRAWHSFVEDPKSVDALAKKLVR
jgi:hypothetical protein